MTLREFFVGRAIVFSLLIVIGLSVWGYNFYFSNTKNVGTSQPPTFIWKYKKAESLNLDGIPETNVFLEATYGSGAIEIKLIDTSPSGCNDLPDNEADSAPNSTVAQCYGAGLGYRYKVIKGQNSYLIERKKFEEGSPDYNPPLSQYGIISEFPLNK